MEKNEDFVKIVFSESQLARGSGRIPLNKNLTYSVLPVGGGKPLWEEAAREGRGRIP